MQAQQTHMSNSAHMFKWGSLIIGAIPGRGQLCVRQIQYKIYSNVSYLIQKRGMWMKFIIKDIRAAVKVPLDFSLPESFLHI